VRAQEPWPIFLLSHSDTMYYELLHGCGHYLGGALAFVVGMAWDEILRVRPIRSPDTDSSILIHVSTKSCYSVSCDVS
jgi:hypothetical protein